MMKIATIRNGNAGRSYSILFAQRKEVVCQDTTTDTEKSGLLSRCNEGNTLKSN